jgi:hypothetical protein
MLALELNDAGLLVARAAQEGIEVLAESPGFALLEGPPILVGEAAASRARVRPLLSHSRFWRELSTQSLSRSIPSARTTADIAYAHLKSLMEPFKDDGVLLAIPAGYSREQLGLLLGVANEASVRIAGIVDAGLAASTLGAAPLRVLHLDIELHQTVLTVLERDRSGNLRRTRYEILLATGLEQLRQSFIQYVADIFIRKTRFDPLHEAANEQRLADQLPTWLGQLRTEPNLTIEMTFGAAPLSIDVVREDFLRNAAERHYAAILKLVQTVRLAGEPVNLRVSHRIAELPGLIERLSTLRDCDIQELPRGAAAIGALAHQGSIQRSPEALTPIYQLPVEATHDELAAPSAASALPVEERPTHVLYQGKAWKLGRNALTVGWSVPPGSRALQLPSSSPGVSRSHCTLVDRGGSVLIEDHSTYGSFVNEERVNGRSMLAVGDRVRLGTPGVTLELIRVIDDDATP